MSKKFNKYLKNYLTCKEHASPDNNKIEDEVLHDNDNSFISDAMNHLHAMNEHCIVCTTDADGVITRVNDNFCKITAEAITNIPYTERTK